MVLAAQQRTSGWIEGKQDRGGGSNAVGNAKERPNPRRFVQSSRVELVYDALEIILLSDESSIEPQQQHA
jgi:hypothetical protein